MIGYKKCVVKNAPEVEDLFALVELEIPDDAQWQQPEHNHDPEGATVKFWKGMTAFWTGTKDFNDNTEKKCRADKAKVLKIHGGFDKVTSLHDPAFDYVVGKEIVPTKPYDTGAWACGDGIHFFLNKDTAINYSNGGSWKFISKQVPNESAKGSYTIHDETRIPAAIVDPE